MEIHFSIGLLKQDRVKILLIKIGAIGDVINALPVVHSIKMQHRHAHVTWICGQVVEPILRHVPDVDHLIVVRENDVFSGSPFRILKALSHVYKKVALRRFDFILNYHVDPRYLLFDWLSVSRRRFMFSRAGSRPIPLPGRSRTYEHLRLFQQSDSNDDQIISFPHFHYDKVQIDESVSRHFNKPVVILSPGGAKNFLNEQTLRRWPIQNYRTLAQKFVESGHKVMIVGANSDDWILPYFGDIDVLNLVGQLSLVQLIYVMRLSRLVITHDSGPFHLGVFAQSPFVIGLFGPTNEREVSYGRLVNAEGRVKTIWGGAYLNCRPCYYGKYFSQECKNNLCMQDISVIEVFNQAVQLLSSN